MKTKIKHLAPFRNTDIISGDLEDLDKLNKQINETLLDMKTDTSKAMQRKQNNIAAVVELVDSTDLLWYFTRLGGTSLVIKFHDGRTLLHYWPIKDTYKLAGRKVKHKGLDKLLKQIKRSIKKEGKLNE